MADIRNQHFVVTIQIKNFNHVLIRTELYILPSVLRRFALTSLPNVLHFLFYALSISGNALWLAALNYTNPYLFHYFLSLFSGSQPGRKARAWFID
jgi:hypothetical protein